MFHFLMIVIGLIATYFLWRITDQMPDLVFRLAEMQRDMAEIRRHLNQQKDATAAPPAQAEDEG